MAEWNGGQGSTPDGHGVTGMTAEDAQAQLQAAMDEARAQVDHYVEAAATFVRQRPVLCIAGAVAVGYLVGKLASRR